jgi:hypothetical protein
VGSAYSARTLAEVAMFASVEAGDFWSLYTFYHIPYRKSRSLNIP